MNKYKYLSEGEKKMAKSLVDMAITNAVATHMLETYLKDKKNREKIINRLKRGD